MSLFKLGSVTLNSGQVAEFKIDCDALTGDDWNCIAFLLSKRLPRFGSVEGVPRGGMMLAEKLVQYITQGPLLIVDDVLTTGGSMERHRAGRDAIGAVLFARSIPDEWILPLFMITREVTKTVIEYEAIT